MHGYMTLRSSISRSHTPRSWHGESSDQMRRRTLGGTTPRPDHFMFRIGRITMLPRHVSLAELREVLPEWGYLRLPRRSIRVPEAIQGRLAQLMGIEATAAKTTCCPSGRRRPRRVRGALGSASLSTTRQSRPRPSRLFRAGIRSGAGPSCPWNTTAVALISTVPRARQSNTLKSKGSAAHHPPF